MWGEALDLIEEAAGDPSTPLGAELLDFRFPASVVDVYTLSLLIGLGARDEAAFRKLQDMYLPMRSGGRAVTVDEYEQATAEFMAEFGIPREKWAGEMEQLAAPLREREDHG